MASDAPAQPTLTGPDDDAIHPSSPNAASPSQHNDKKRKRTSLTPTESEAALSTPADSDTPPLPDEAPPLPNEAPPDQPDDGWEPIWEPTHQAFYFYNRFTQATQWENPRVPAASSDTPGAAPGTTGTGTGTSSSLGAPPGMASAARRPHGGYNPAIHGDYDPTADYALEAKAEEDEEAAAREAAYAAAVAAAGGGGSGGGGDGADAYAATGHFNRFTGRWQAGHINPDQHSDENKSKRQLNAFFDVDAAANSHDGRSLKAERQGKKLSKKEIKAFQQKRREKKEEKRRAWLRD